MTIDALGLAHRIVELINSQPRTPSAQQIADIIQSAVSAVPAKGPIPLSPIPSSNPEAVAVYRWLLSKKRPAGCASGAGDEYVMLGDMLNGI